jgi:hypothetical protein
VGKAFNFGGDTIGFVDVTLGSQLAWLKAVEKISGIKLLDESKVPLLAEWAKRFLAVDSMDRSGFYRVWRGLKSTSECWKKQDGRLLRLSDSDGFMEMEINVIAFKILAGLE